MCVHIRDTHKYNSITGGRGRFHDNLPDDDPAGSKYVAQVHNETHDNTITMVIYYKSVVLMVV
jgi:hypothetical protein